MQKQDKLDKILAFINGGLSFETLRPPKNYVVFQTNDVYNLDGINMTEDEFEKWQQENLREIDNITMFKEDQSFSQQHKQPEPDTKEPEPVAEQPEVIEAKEQPKKRQRKRRKKKEQPIAIEPVPELKTSGLMSRYGIDWAISDRSLYN